MGRSAARQAVATAAPSATASAASESRAASASSAVQSGASSVSVASSACCARRAIGRGADGERSPADAVRSALHVAHVPAREGIAQRAEIAARGDEEVVEHGAGRRVVATGEDVERAHVECRLARQCIARVRRRIPREFGEPLAQLGGEERDRRRLGHEVIHAHLPRAVRLALHHVRAEREHGRALPAGAAFVTADRLRQLVAIHPRHVQIGEHEAVPP